MQVVGAGIGSQASMDALHLDPVAGGGHGGNERLAVDHALALERGRLGEHRGRIHRIHQVDRTVQRTLGAHAHHFGHQLHQPAFATVRIALQAVVTGKETVALDRIVGTSDRTQRHAQFAQPGFAGAQPAEQCRARVVVMETVGGQADAHRKLRDR
ncbi:hypothetical protein D3C72_1397390 [compost metagenome]